MKSNRTMMIGAGVLVAALVVGQAFAFVIDNSAWKDYIGRLPVILAQLGFWGPICAIISAGFVMITLRLLGFASLEEIRKESVEQNNPTPAIIFVGTLIASILFLTLVIRP
jgi:hypothetical protein